MTEIITIHIGKAGLQVGNNLWDLFRQQHGVNPDGTIDPQNHQAFTDVAFSLNSQKRCTARCIFIDVEGDTIDEITSGTQRQLFSTLNCFSAYQQPTKIYPKGRRYDKLVELAMERIRYMIGKSENIEGILIFNSIGGGTGSGVASLLAEFFSVSYPKLNMFYHTIMDSRAQSSSYSQTYNSVFTISNILEHSESRQGLSIMFDSSAIHNICSRNLLVPSPSLANINSVISQWVSSFTTPSRFGSPYQRTMRELYQRLVPYHCFKFMMPSYSPLFPSVMPFYGEEPIFNIIMNCFEPANMMVLSDPRAGKYISVYMGFRGDIPTNRISSILTGIKSKKIVQFVDWTPTGSIFKFARRYPVQLPGDCLLAAKQSCCGLSNNTAFGQVSDRIIYKFDRLFQGRKGVDKYIEEGMQEDEFTEARERLCILSADYAQAGKETQDQAEIQ